MYIKYDEAGHILSCSPDERSVEQGSRVLDVDDESLPIDFLATFALGKYVVKEEAVVEDEAFELPKPPDPTPFEAPPTPEAEPAGVGFFGTLRSAILRVFRRS